MLLRLKMLLRPKTPLHLRMPLPTPLLPKLRLMLLLQMPPLRLRLMLPRLSLHQHSLQRPDRHRL